MTLPCPLIHAFFSPLNPLSLSHAPLSGGRWLAQEAGGDNDVVGGLFSLPSGFTLLGATRKQPVPRPKAAEGGSTLVFQVAAPLQRHLQGLLDAPATRAPPT